MACTSHRQNKDFVLCAYAWLFCFLLLLWDWMLVLFLRVNVKEQHINVSMVLKIISTNVRCWCRVSKPAAPDCIFPIWFCHWLILLMHKQQYSCRLPNLDLSWVFSLLSHSAVWQKFMGENAVTVYSPLELSTPSGFGVFFSRFTRKSIGWSLGNGGLYSWWRKDILLTHWRLLT